jgi:hypothetical protein
MRDSWRNFRDCFFDVLTAFHIHNIFSRQELQVALLKASYRFIFSFLGFLEGDEVTSLITANGIPLISIQTLPQMTDVF